MCLNAKFCFNNIPAPKALWGLCVDCYYHYADDDFDSSSLKFLSCFFFFFLGSYFANLSGRNIEVGLDGATNLRYILI